MGQTALSLTDVGIVFLTVRGMPEGQTLIVGTVPTDTIRGREWQYSDVILPQKTCDAIVTEFTDYDEE